MEGKGGLGEEGEVGERGDGEGNGKGGSWGNSAVFVGGIDAPGLASVVTSV